MPLPPAPEPWLRYFTCREKQVLKEPFTSSKRNELNFKQSIEKFKPEVLARLLEVVDKDNLEEIRVFNKHTA